MSCEPKPAPPRPLEASSRLLGGQADVWSITPPALSCGAPSQSRPDAAKAEAALYARRPEVALRPRAGRPNGARGGASGRSVWARACPQQEVRKEETGALRVGLFAFGGASCACVAPAELSGAVEAALRAGGGRTLFYFALFAAGPL